MVRLIILLVEIMSGLTSKGFHQIEIKKRTLTSGIYYLRLKTASQQLIKKVFIE
jgi:hypothetical protein